MIMFYSNVTSTPSLNSKIDILNITHDQIYIQQWRIIKK